MKKKLFYILVFLIIVIVSFYVFIAINFGKGVANMGKDLHKVQKEWKENKEEPLDTIKNLVVKKIDSINKKTKNSNFKTEKK